MIVAPHGHDVVTVSVRCPRFGGISHVRLSPEQAANLAGALTGIVLDHAANRGGSARSPKRLPPGAAPIGACEPTNKPGTANSAS